MFAASYLMGSRQRARDKGPPEYRTQLLTVLWLLTAGLLSSFFRSRRTSSQRPPRSLRSCAWTCPCLRRRRDAAAASASRQSHLVIIEKHDSNQDEARTPN